MIYSVRLITLTARSIPRRTPYTKLSPSKQATNDSQLRPPPKQSTQPTPQPPYPPRQLNVLLHNRHPLRMYSTQIGVFKQVHHKRLRRLLQRLYRVRLPPQHACAAGDFVDCDFADLISSALSTALHSPFRPSYSGKGLWGCKAGKHTNRAKGSFNNSKSVLF